MPAYDDISIRNRREKAINEVTDLCEGKKRWTMSIPYDSNYDSDAILRNALDDIEYLLSVKALQQAQIATLEKQSRPNPVVDEN
jgi:hypothetical protein